MTYLRSVDFPTDEGVAAGLVILVRRYEDGSGVGKGNERGTKVERLGREYLMFADEHTAAGQLATTHATTRAG